VAAQSIIVVDTGFVLSVAAVADLAPLLGNRWEGRTTWPREVHSELLYRDRKPGQGVPAGLARKALNGAALWLPTPVEIDDDADVERMFHIARQLGGTDEHAHVGEAAGVILAERYSGILATEDLAAAQLIRANFEVKTTCITAVLQKFGTDGTWTPADVTAALKALQAKDRPNVDGLTAGAVIDGSWSRWRR